jgi:hypothetical protein
MPNYVDAFYPQILIEDASIGCGECRECRNSRCRQPLGNLRAAVGTMETIPLVLSRVGACWLLGGCRRQSQCLI